MKLISFCLLALVLYGAGTLSASELLSVDTVLAQAVSAMQSRDSVGLWNSFVELGKQVSSADREGYSPEQIIGLRSVLMNSLSSEYSWPPRFYSVLVPFFISSLWHHSCIADSDIERELLSLLCMSLYRAVVLCGPHVFGHYCTFDEQIFLVDIIFSMGVRRPEARQDARGLLMWLRPFLYCHLWQRVPGGVLYWGPISVIFV